MVTITKFSATGIIPLFPFPPFFLYLCRIAFSLCVISIISASFTGVCLSLAGVMGKACGNHNNFSELLENIVDNPRTWTNKDTSFYPLAAVMLNLSHYPLRVSDTLTACRSNASLFRAFHLEQRYDLEDRIWLSPTKKVSLSSFLSPSSPSTFSPSSLFLSVSFTLSV